MSLEDFNYISIYNVIELTLVKLSCFHEHYYSQHDSVLEATLLSFRPSQAGVSKKRHIRSCHLGNLAQSSPSPSYVHCWEF